jgi:hypothetical protein
MSNIHRSGASSLRNSKKKKWIALGMVGVFALAGGAYAYFTTTGSGTGSTQVGTSTALTITATITPPTGGIVPGGPVAPVTFSVNNGGTGNQWVDTISLVSVGAFTTAGHTTVAAGCDTSYFSVADVDASQNVPTGDTAITAAGSLVFADSGDNQDACKNKYLLLTFSSN